MDPNATFDAARDAYCGGRWADCLDAALALQLWVRKRGFAPARPDWATHLAEFLRAACRYAS